MSQDTPKLFACPRCALKVQRGRGPGQLVWHDCIEVERLRKEKPAAEAPASLTATEALERLLHIAVSKAAGLPGKDLVNLVAHVGHIHEIDRGGGEVLDGRKKGKKGGLLTYLRPDDPSDPSEGPGGEVHEPGAGEGG